MSRTLPPPSPTKTATYDFTGVSTAKNPLNLPHHPEQSIPNQVRTDSEINPDRPDTHLKSRPKATPLTGSGPRQPSTPEREDRR